MTVSQLIKAVVDNSGLRVQYVSECIIGAKLVKRTKNAPAHTRIELCTNAMTPDDLMRKPAMTGILMWIPTTLYEETLATPTPSESSKEKA